MQLMKVEYATKPGFGISPWFTLEVFPDRGLFVGRRLTATCGAKVFPLSPLQFPEFQWLLMPALAVATRAYLEGDRPSYGGDRTLVEVIWHHANGDRVAYCSSGMKRCHADHATGHQLNAAQEAAFSVFNWEPIVDLIGPKERRREFALRDSQKKGPF